MTKEILRKYNARTRASNEAFKKMSPEQKKVTIAKDVLKQLAVGRLKAENGTYMHSETLNGDGDEDLRDAFKQMESCDVCAIGAAFVATVDRLDELKLGDVYYGGWSADDGVMRDYLERHGVFEPEELEAMETAFEYGSFSDGLKNSRSRMEAVMNAVVACGGFDICSALNYDPAYEDDAQYVVDYEEVA